MEEKILEILERNFTDSIRFDRNKATEELLLLHNVVGQSEQLVCDDCGYEINPAGICINMNCSTNENP